MKKRLSIILLVLLMLSVTAFSAYAEVSEIPSERQKSLLEDEAGLLDPYDAVQLLEMLEEVSERNRLEIAIVTVDDTNGKTATEFADDYYDYNGYGYGENDDGMLLLLSMNERDWAISTYGTATDIFSNYQLDYIMNDCGVLSYLGSNQYFDAFTVFVCECDESIGRYESGYYEDEYYGEQYDEYYNAQPTYDYVYGGTQTKSGSPFSKVFFSILLGFAASFVIMKIISAPLKSVRMQKDAANYMKGSARITDARDVFLYSNVTRTPINTQNNNGNRHSGGGFSGGSIHTSSSGRSHGGASGKF